MKTYRGVDAYIHVFLASALVGGKWSVSRSVSFTSGKEPSEPTVGELHSRSGRCGEETILDAVAIRTPDPLLRLLYS
jgi:hypothetical protein